MARDDRRDCCEGMWGKQRPSSELAYEYGTNGRRPLLHTKIFERLTRLKNLENDWIQSRAQIMCSNPSMILRVRSRDGLERVRVHSPESATVLDLKRSIEEQLFAADDDQEILALSINKDLLTKDDIGAWKGLPFAQTLSLTHSLPFPLSLGFCPEGFTDMPDHSILASLGLSSGSIVYMLTSTERKVESVKLPDFMKAGRKTMTIEEMVAKQTRIERQESSSVASVSFDMHAANAFQAYVSSLGFHNKRGGILYGEVKDDKVYVHAIYEPEQQGSTEELNMERNTPEEARADAIAAAWGWKKVGQVISISAKSERDYMFSALEVMSMAAIQQELGELAVTGVVSQECPDSDDEDGLPSEVHFEAFQVSKQCADMYSKGWFSVGDSPNEFCCVNPSDKNDKTPVIVGRTDVNQVDVDYFLVPVAIDSHSSGFSSSFPVENRLTGQSAADLKARIRSGKSLSESLKDFHAVMYITGQAGMSSGEAASFASSVLLGEVNEGSGYGMIALSIAGV